MILILGQITTKTYLYVHEKLQRNSYVGSCLKFFIFRPYGFEYLEFLTNARRGAMRSKHHWVFYRDLERWPGPQKVQFREITGYPEVVGLILALLRFYKSLQLIKTALCNLDKDMTIWQCFFSSIFLALIR